MPNRTIYLVDASPYIFRAYFALPDMRAPDGAPVSAVRGFADFLLRLVSEEQPTHLGIAFDESLGTSYRNDIYPPYKSSRGLPPPELEAQLQACFAVGEALGATCWSCERYEADDILATVAAPLTRASHSVVIVTSDKDLAQLVSDRVTLYDLAAGKRYRPNDVVEKFGVRPDQIADYLGLAGDSVDDIPGVRGIGPKTAVVLLAAFGDVETIYRRIDEVLRLDLRGAKSVHARLLRDREMALLSKSLATVDPKAPVEAELEDLELAGADPALVDPLFERLGFTTIRERITRWMPA